jgi:putative salt-induced outer membrane protein YdiY
MRTQVAVHAALLVVWCFFTSRSAEAQQPEVAVPPPPVPVVDTVARAVPAAPKAKAKETAAPNPDRWKVSSELSFTDQSGNSSLQVLTGGVSFSHLQKDDFELEGSVKTRYGKSQKEVVARNHVASLTFDLHPKAMWSPFLYATGERDPFKRLDLRFSGGAGAKFSPVKEKRGEVSLSLALLYSFEAVRATEEDPESPTRSLGRWSLRANGKRELGNGISLHQTTFYQPVVTEMADYLLQSDTGMKVLLTRRLALSLEYSLDRTARPPEGVEPDNRLFKTGLIIDF